MKYIERQHGFSLVELMVAITIGLIISYAILEIYLAQSQLYKTSNSQNLIQSTENAITHLVTPTIREAGFVGCGSMSSAISILNNGGPPPIGAINISPSALVGYSGSGSSFTITQDNISNSGNANDWSPSLEPTLVGNVQKGNDVLVVLGSIPGGAPIGVSLVDSGSGSFVLGNTGGATINTGQFGALSDCVKTCIFQITGVAGTTISHNVGSGTLENADSVFPVGFSVGSQFIPLQQTSFFVGHGQGGQSALMRGTLVGGLWTVEPLVPGVELMKVQYGIGSNGSITQYVSADAVPDWSSVYAIRIGFLIVGRTGSGSLATNQYNVLDTQVTVPADNKLRHVFEITIHLRNSLS